MRKKERQKENDAMLNLHPLYGLRKCSKGVLGKLTRALVCVPVCTLSGLGMSAREENATLLLESTHKKKEKTEI